MADPVRKLIRWASKRRKGKSRVWKYKRVTVSGAKGGAKS
jgi:hypothetical protein